MQERHQCIVVKDAQNTRRNATKRNRLYDIWKKNHYISFTVSFSLYFDLRCLFPTKLRHAQQIILRSIHKKVKESPISTMKKEGIRTLLWLPFCQCWDSHHHRMLSFLCHDVRLASPQSAMKTKRINVFCRCQDSGHRRLLLGFSCLAIMFGSTSPWTTKGHHGYFPTERVVRMLPPLLLLPPFAIVFADIFTILINSSYAKERCCLRPLLSSLSSPSKAFVS